MTYSKFLATKRLVVPNYGHEIAQDDVHPMLFDFQRDLVTWALAKGRSAIFADTGLGKTFMQLEWARLLNLRALIVAPLAVAQQTITEARKLGIHVQYTTGEPTNRISITNYDQLHNINPDDYQAVVLDESSILKNYTGQTRTQLIEMFKHTPYRLACTATPAPNDIAEIANHAEFLGIMSRVEMLASFFVHDDQGWRLKGHARKPFYKWMASWGMAIKKPSDLGYSDDGFVLPSLNVHPVIVETDWVPDGQLFASHLKGITERSQVRKDTLDERAQRVVDLVDSEPDEQWLIWVGLNDESDALASLIPDAVVVEGSQPADVKAERLLGFAENRYRVLITKPSIAGFGMNWQNCRRMVFNGMNDSYEQFYQAIRRCWRFGQTRPVDVWVVVSEPETHIYNNVLRKEQEAQVAMTGLIDNVAEYERTELATHHEGGEFVYLTDETSGDDWTLKLGDSCERIAEIPDNSVDLSVFSPPFESLYTYTPSERDLGNSSSPAEFWEHFSYISEGLLRITKPGRNVCIHVQQLSTTKTVDGFIGMRDFRGATIQHFINQGFIYHGEICIDKDPQAQAIRTKTKSLMFVQLHKDSSWMRSAFADYIIVMRKPGDNQVPVIPDITNEDWIRWARPIWYGIRETETLNVAEARSEDDERHIAPLQLGTIRRLVRLYTNPGELVFSPFAGIGSEGFEAIRLGRRFLGIELKPEYYETAVKNLERAEQEARSGTLFDLLEDEETKNRPHEPADR